MPATSEGLARHFTKYLRAGFWMTILAAAMNGVYWRIGAPLPTARLLGVLTAGVALTAVYLNGRSLMTNEIAGAKTGRRVTWLLLLTAVLVIGSVVVDLTGLRQSWGLE